MPHVMTVAALAVLSAVGAVIGTHLGRDAVAAINPIFFSELPETRVFVNNTPAPFRLGQPDPIRPAHDWNNVFNLDGRPVCLDCPANLVDSLYVAAEPAPRTTRQGGDEAVPVEFERPISSRDLDRYSSYPVTEEEARLQDATPDFYAERTLPHSESGEEGAPPIGM